MQTFQIDFSVPSGFITPWHADTLFGHLCWVAEHNDCFQNFKGASGLIALYENGPPPLIVSDAFPAGFLPAPANLKKLFDTYSESDLTTEHYIFLKALKAMEHLTVEEFLAYQKGKPFAISQLNRQPLASIVTLHNQINRFTGATGAEGSLYELEEFYLKNSSLRVYIKIQDDFKVDALRLFELFAAGGFGKKRSSGKGALRLVSFEPFTEFDAVKNADGFISLSHFVPAPDDPVDGAYKSMVKYGKLGDVYALCGNPFKKPLLMLKPGAVFNTGALPKPYYGKMLQGISEAQPQVVQYAYAFAVPSVYASGMQH